MAEAARRIEEENLPESLYVSQEFMLPVRGFMDEMGGIHYDSHILLAQGTSLTIDSKSDAEVVFTTPNFVSIDGLTRKIDSFTVDLRDLQKALTDEEIKPERRNPAVPENFSGERVVEVMKEIRMLVDHHQKGSMELAWIRLNELLDDLLGEREEKEEKASLEQFSEAIKGIFRQGDNPAKMIKAVTRLFVENTIDPRLKEMRKEEVKKLAREIQRLSNHDIDLGKSQCFNKQYYPKQ